MPTDFTGQRVVVTGGAGFLGQVVCQKLRQRGCGEILVPRRADYDLTRESDVRAMYADMRPQIVIHLAAEVGGIGANQENPGRFFYANMAIALHLIEHARINKIDKFVQAGTICAYPKLCPVPFREDDLWTGYPEETNAPYGIAKKAALVMLDGYQRQYGLCGVYLLPVNLYGPGDNFDRRSSHVIPALIRKCMEAIERGEDHIVCWGTGRVSREFLYVDDGAEGIIRAAEVLEEPIPVNLGTGSEITIKDLAQLIANVTGFEGEIRWDVSKPDGQPRRRLDTSRAEQLLSWSSKVSLEEGLPRTVEWFRQQLAEGKHKCSPIS